MFATEEIELIEYDGFVLRMRQETVDMLNSMGGCRMFSSGDFLRTQRKQVFAFLDDCATRGLKAKTITKNVHFVYEAHDHPAITVINLSVDSLGPRQGSPVPLTLAKQLKERYSKLRIRCVVLDDNDLAKYGDDVDIDVITLNHGANGFKWFSEEERANASEKYPGRVCCLTGKCLTCSIHCGLKENDDAGTGSTGSN
jgi:hypothetical protein